MKDTQMNQRFAVKHTIDNEVTVIQLFDQLEEAKAFAQEVATHHKAGIMSVISAQFAEGTLNIVGNCIRLYEVYPCK